MKEFTDKNPSICGIDHESFNSTNILRTISTSTFQELAANAVVDLLADDEDHALNEIKHIDFSTFHQDWEAFVIEFQQSTTYALAHSSAADLPLPIVDDDDDRMTLDDGAD